MLQVNYHNSLLRTSTPPSIFRSGDWKTAALPLPNFGRKSSSGQFLIRPFLLVALDAPVRQGVTLIIKGWLGGILLFGTSNFVWCDMSIMALKKIIFASIEAYASTWVD